MSTIVHRVCCVCLISFMVVVYCTHGYETIIAKCADKFEQVGCDGDDIITDTEAYYGEPKGLLTSCSKAIKVPFNHCTELIDVSKHEQYYNEIRRNCLEKHKCDTFSVRKSAETHCTTFGSTEYVILKLICSPKPQQTYTLGTIITIETLSDNTQPDLSLNTTTTGEHSNSTAAGNQNDNDRAANTGPDVIVMSSTIIIAVIMAIVMIVIIFEVRRRKAEAYQRAVHTVMSLRHRRASDALITDEPQVTVVMGNNSSNAANQNHSGSELEINNTWDASLNRGNGRVGETKFPALDPSQVYEDPNAYPDQMYEDANFTNEESAQLTDAIYANTSAGGVDVNWHNVPEIQTETINEQHEGAVYSEAGDDQHDTDLPLYYEGGSCLPDIRYSAVHKSPNSVPPVVDRSDHRELSNGTNPRTDYSDSGPEIRIATQLSLEGTNVVDNALYETSPEDTASHSPTDFVDRGQQLSADGGDSGKGSVIKTQLSLEGTNVVDNCIYESADSCDLSPSDKNPLTSRSKPKLYKMPRVEE